jgi:orotidine-5'-phosphate decarboxylase
MTDVRDRLALALDVGGPQEAEATARRLAPWFGIAKVGLELYAEAGPGILEQLRSLGFSIFADLKLYDIPTTVERAARVLGRRGVDFLNFPAGVTGLAEGAREVSRPPPTALAVTVLTSDADVSAFDERLDSAVAAGCGGVVCSAHEIAAVKSRAPTLATMVPGIRLPGDAQHDQARVASPGEAFARGADWLVIGRTVTSARDPESAAEAVTRDARDALARRARTG